jgi:hypothetical protein
MDRVPVAAVPAAAGVREGRESRIESLLAIVCRLRLKKCHQKQTASIHAGRFLYQSIGLAYSNLSGRVYTGRTI